MDFLSRNIHGCILLIDLVGRIVDTNEQCQTLYGYSVQETLALDGSTLLRTAQPDGDLAALWQCLPKHGNLVLETEHRRKDGSLVPVELSLRAFNVADTRCIQTIVRDIGERKFMEEERQRQATRLAKLSHRLISLQERERRQLSAELHDRTSPNLAALDINLRSLAKSLPPGSNGETIMLLDDAKALLSDTENSLRQVCADLRPPVLDYAGLLPALQSYAHQFSMRTGIAVVLESPQVPVLDPEVESTLFRIAQEALSNCAKHADALQVAIHLTIKEQQINMEITDDGDGFAIVAPGAVDATTGLGLLSMSERAQFVGGSLQVDSCLGQGTRVVVTIPTSPGTLQSTTAWQPGPFPAQQAHVRCIDTGVPG
jgi:PAS domain S-box-containing protein